MSGANRTTKSRDCSYSCRRVEFTSHIAICEGRKWLRVVAKKHKFGIMFVYRRGGETSCWCVSGA